MFTVFNCALLTFSKNKTLESWHNWLLSNWNRLLNWKGSGTLSQSSKFSKRFLKIIALACIHLSIGQGWWLNELCFKRYIQKCTKTHHDVTDLINHRMTKNTKTWIFWEQNKTFLQDKKILNLSLRSYHFVAEVTFKMP